MQGFSSSSMFLLFVTAASCIRYISSLVWTTNPSVMVTLWNRSRNHLALKDAEELKKKKKKLGQFPEEAEQSQLCPQSSGHSSGQSRKAPSAGDLQGRNLAWPHLPLLCVRSSGSQRNLSFASRCSKLGQGQCSLLPNMLLVAEPASQHRAVARWEPSLR